MWEIDGEIKKNKSESKVAIANQNEYFIVKNM